MEEGSLFETRWQLASSEQRARYNNLMSSHPRVDWTYNEKECLLWLCQLNIDTFDNFEVILDEIKQNWS